MRTEGLYGPWPLFVALLIGGVALIGSYAFGPMSYVLAGTVAGLASMMVVRSAEKIPLAPDDKALAPETFDIPTATRGWRRAPRYQLGWESALKDAFVAQGVFALLALVAWKFGPVL